MGVFASLLLIFLSTIGGMSTTVDAGTASSTVRVLNTPPVFETGTDAYEVIASSSTSPTRYGTTLTWGAQVKDSGSNSVYLLVCRTNAAPTASSSTAPTCNGGASNLLAVSDAPVSTAWPAASLVYATSSPLSDPFIGSTVEEMNWYAFLCDTDSHMPKCTASANTGTAGNADASPFNVNHPHNFTVFAQNGPVNPGQTITFTATAAEAHQDVVGGTDAARLFVCKDADFTGSDCGAGGAWATTTVAVQTNPTASVTFAIPFQDSAFQAYGYVLDNHNSVATGVAQGSSAPFSINNVAPTVVASSITYASSSLVLTNPLAETNGFVLNFTASDNNSCISTSSAPEVSDVRVQLFRSDLSGTCRAGIPGDYNANNCYTSEVATTTWNILCTPNGASCTGNTDTTVDWSCTFPLWSNADPTGAGTPWSAQMWDARVTAIDDNAASGLALTDSPARRAEVEPFTYMDLGAGSIDFGVFEPGFGNTNLGDEPGSVLGVQSQGNTALDINVQVSDMCPNYSNGCAGNESSNTIFGDRQHYATSSVPYAGPGMFVGSTSSSPLLDLNVKKPTATSTPTSKDTYWGIFVPATLTVSGDYKGVNTLTMVLEANTSTW